MKYDSLCPHHMFDCEPYQHRHCTDCNDVLLAVGGGGDEGRSIDGYEDALGNATVPCETCGNDSLRCRTCAAENPKCAHCRDLEATPCAHCGEPVGSHFRDIAASTEPAKLICPGCADCRNCEECRIGAA